MIYYYSAKVLRVIDGDTIVLNIDLGFNVTIKETIRLYGINTPELRSKNKNEKTKAKIAKDYILKQFKINDNEIEIETLKDKKGKYGRMLGIIHIKDKFGNWINLNHELIKNGMAVKTDY